MSKISYIRISFLIVSRVLVVLTCCRRCGDRLKACAWWAGVGSSSSSCVSTISFTLPTWRWWKSNQISSDFFWYFSIISKFILWKLFLLIKYRVIVLIYQVDDGNQILNNSQIFLLKGALKIHSNFEIKVEIMPVRRICAMI